jgi:hypothetical protein
MNHAARHHTWTAAPTIKRRQTSPMGPPNTYALALIALGGEIAA